MIKGLIKLLALLSLTVSAANPSTNQYQSEVFFVGGNYKKVNGSTLFTGQMFVEKWTPEKVTQPLPIVLIHGAGQSAVNWMTTPDGRKGWAHYFINQGYVVYMVDQPARSRSAWHPATNGDLRIFSAEVIEKKFTASAQFEGQWPQAGLHTQWPGSGRQGDPVFDQYYSSIVESLKSHVESSELVSAAGVALLDKIGPAILLTHSQSGPFGWLIADKRPNLVKAIVTIEPSGPPIKNKAGKSSLPWGVSVIPVTYEPAIAMPEELVVAQQPIADSKTLVRCWEQQEPARQLVNLKGIPVLFMVSESSYHAEYDHCTSNWLTQAGVNNDFLRLEQQGIHGNGHMLMLEKNNMEIVKLINSWLLKKTAALN
ncbi:alpha/beta hydrolase [Vibrio maritimus]|uniref:alpha/beta hydrolase n=1 Tax=Vibrio maritimus TaxID=990268 RepID=UPI001F169942|nr:alpha/beta hydrolase [Vibrio maritimus]